MSDKKWGYKKANAVIIKPEYDTAFAFDAKNQIALVANKNEFNKITNPLSGEETTSLDYFYINSKNKKLKLLDEKFPDSVVVLPNQQELNFNYLDTSFSVFKILFQNKVFLFSKNGKQLSTGFDNIFENKSYPFYILENNTEIAGKIIRKKGLIDTSGKIVVACKYKYITINKDDSLIYCCSALLYNKQNDDVIDYKGKLIYTNKNHIEFSSKNIHVIKLYEPESFIIENKLGNSIKTFDGSVFYNLKNNKGMIISKDNWYVIDFLSGQKQKVNRLFYFQIVNYLCGI